MIVADTSVLIKLVAPEPLSDIARRLRGDGIVAPAIWVAEAANVFWQKIKRLEMPRQDASDLLGVLLNTIGTLPVEPLAQPALGLASDLDHPAYDCLFLQCAIREGTYVVTNDRRFAGAVRRHGKWADHIRLLEEFAD